MVEKKATSMKKPKLFFEELETFEYVVKYEL
jgi:hypothetical protein